MNLSKMPDPSENSEVEKLDQSLDCFLFVTLDLPESYSLGVIYVFHHDGVFRAKLFSLFGCYHQVLRLLTPFD